MNNQYKDYHFQDEGESHMHSTFMPYILSLLKEVGPGCRVLDVGCGNGATCGDLQRRGYNVTGIDLGKKGIEIARAAHPDVRFEVLGADQDMMANLGSEPFDVVISTEVVEHLYAPREWARGCFSALRPSGLFICTTPYHGYLKNLALSVAGKWDKHASPLWDGGHIKLWSKNTLSTLLTDAGFEHLRFRGLGRMPFLWMTMVMACNKPA